MLIMFPVKKLENMLQISRERTIEHSLSIRKLTYD